MVARWGTFLDEAICFLTLMVAATGDARHVINQTQDNLPQRSDVGATHALVAILSDDRRISSHPRTSN
jgi:hypothetical protein